MAKTFGRKQAETLTVLLLHLHLHAWIEGSIKGGGGGKLKVGTMHDHITQQKTTLPAQSMSQKRRIDVSHHTLATPIEQYLDPVCRARHTFN